MHLAVTDCAAVISAVIDGSANLIGVDLARAQARINLSADADERRV